MGVGGDAPPADSRPRRRGFVYAAIAALVLLVAGVLILRDGDSPSVKVVGQEAGRRAPTITASPPTFATPAAPGEAKPSETSPSGSPAATGDPGAQAHQAAAPQAEADVDANDAEDSWAATNGPPVPGPDRQGPNIGRVVPESSQLWTAVDDGSCGTSLATPSRATVWVGAGDASGIESVTLVLSGPVSGSYAMTPIGGATYEVSIGPFASGSVPAAGTGEIGLLAEAKDGAGNTSSSAGRITLNDCQG